jgi:hypothetical protein
MMRKGEDVDDCLLVVGEDKDAECMQIRHMLHNTHVLLQLTCSLYYRVYNIFLCKVEFKMLKKGLVEDAA